MPFIIAVFRSRADTLAFKNILSSYGIGCCIINTPRQTSTSCGICVKFPIDAFGLAKQVHSRRCFNSFIGFFKVSGAASSLRVEQIM